MSATTVPSLTIQPDNFFNLGWASALLGLPALPPAADVAGGYMVGYEMAKDTFWTKPTSDTVEAMGKLGQLVIQVQEPRT